MEISIRIVGVSDDCVTRLARGGRARPWARRPAEGSAFARLRRDKPAGPPCVAALSRAGSSLDRLRAGAAALLLLPALLLAGAAPAPAIATRPNVLLICIDDLKPLLGCYGAPLARTPQLDRFAASGLRFDRAYANLAACAPSRIALVTGVRPTSLGIYDLQTSFRAAAPDAVSLPQLFRQHGWHTVSLGKVLHDSVPHRDPPSWSESAWEPPGGFPEHLYARPENKAMRRAAGSRSPGAPKSTAPRGPAFESADVPDQAYSDGLIADEAVRRLQVFATQPSTPFFLAVGFVKPHLPFCAPRKYWDLHRRSDFVLPARRTPPAGVPEYTLPRGSEVYGYSGVPAARPLPDDYQLELIHGYHAAVSYVDAQAGRVLDELDRLGLAGRTLVVVWGDHGWHLGDHGFWGKATNLEEAARIPLLMRVPGLTRPGTATRALAESVDLYPTLLELASLANVSVTQRLEGGTLRPWLADPGAPSREAIFHSFARSRPGVGPVVGHAVRTATHRLVEWRAPGAAAAAAEFELYDYTLDPAESANLAPDQPGTVARLRALLATQPPPRPQVKAAGLPTSP